MLYQIRQDVMPVQDWPELYAGTTCIKLVFSLSIYSIGGVFKRGGPIFNPIVQYWALL